MLRLEYAGADEADVIYVHTHGSHSVSPAPAFSVVSAPVDGCLLASSKYRPCAAVLFRVDVSPHRPAACMVTNCALNAAAVSVCTSCVMSEVPHCPAPPNFAMP